MSDYRRPWQTRLLEEVELAREEVRATGKSKGILVIGESGVGKTHAFDILSALYAPIVRDGKRVVPSVRLAPSATAKVNANIQSMLVQMGRPAVGLKGADLFGTFLKAGVAVELEIALFEEMHNAILKSSAAIGKETSEFLKNVWNYHDARISSAWTRPSADGSKPHGLVLVLSGTSDLERPILSSSELQSRFGTVIRAPKPSLFPAAARKDFQHLFKEMRDRYRLPKELSPNDAEHLARVYFATSEHLRHLESLFQRTSTLLAKNGTAPILEVLRHAANAVIPHARITVDGNPFDWSVDSLETRIASLALKAKGSGAVP